MEQEVLRVEGLPEAPLDAAAAFHAGILPRARAMLLQADAIVLVFPPASHEHSGWRLAAVQGLAREAAPKRVNGIAGAEEAGVAQTITWFGGAPGVTGQLLSVGNG